MSKSAEPRLRSVDPRGEFPVGLSTYLFHLHLYSVRCRATRLDATVSPLGLTVMRYHAMGIIDWFQPCTMKELADFSIIDRTTMTRTVDGLVEAGWVDRRRSPEDRREVIVTLTPEGVDKLRAGYSAVRVMNDELMVGITEDEQRQLIRLTQKVFANLAPDAVTRERLLRLQRRDAGA
jgi:DNA-binding MarR family transcriptional regulator